MKISNGTTYIGALTQMLPGFLNSYPNTIKKASKFFFCSKPPSPQVSNTLKINLLLQMKILFLQLDPFFISV